MDDKDLSANSDQANAWLFVHATLGIILEQCCTLNDPPRLNKKLGGKKYSSLLSLSMSFSYYYHFNMCKYASQKQSSPMMVSHLSTCAAMYWFHGDFSSISRTLLFSEQLWLDLLESLLHSWRTQGSMMPFQMSKIVAQLSSPAEKTIYVKEMTVNTRFLGFADRK